MTSVYQREKSSDWSVRSSTNCFLSWTSLTRSPRFEPSPSVSRSVEGRAVYVRGERSVESVPVPARRRAVPERSAIDDRSHRVPDGLGPQLVHAAEVAFRTSLATMERARLTGLVPAQHDMAVSHRREA